MRQYWQSEANSPRRFKDLGRSSLEQSPTAKRYSWRILLSSVHAPTQVDILPASGYYYTTFFVYVTACYRFRMLNSVKLGAGMVR